MQFTEEDGEPLVEFDEGDFDFLDQLDEGMQDPAFASLYDGAAAYRKLKEGKRDLSSTGDDDDRTKERGRAPRGADQVRLARGRQGVVGSRAVSDLLQAEIRRARDEQPRGQH